MKDLLPGDAAELQDASAAGWTGITLVETPGGATVVVSADPEALAARDELWLSMTLEPHDRPRLLRMRLVTSERHDAVAAFWARGGASLDLAYPEGRAIVDRVAERGVLWVVFMEAGTGEVVSIEHIHIDGATEFLRAAVARAGEWHPTPLSPPELTVDAWGAAVRCAPCLAPSAEDTTAVLVVPHDVLVGLENSGGELAVRAPGAGEPWDRLEMLIAWGEETRVVELDLRRPCQRDLAWRLARQRELVVLAAGADGAAPASARLAAPLGPVARALLHRAGRGR